MLLGMHLRSTQTERVIDMSWYTAKNGKHINTDWFDKDRQIEVNKKEADERNMPIIPHFNMHPDISYALNYFKGVVDENNDYRKQIESMKSVKEEVSIADLYTDQDVNKVSDIRRMLESIKSGEVDTSTVKVIEVDGKRILLDGNTRLAALSLLGVKKVKVSVYRKGN